MSKRRAGKPKGAGGPGTILPSRRIPVRVDDPERLVARDAEPAPPENPRRFTTAVPPRQARDNSNTEDIHSQYDAGSRHDGNTDASREAHDHRERVPAPAVTSPTPETVAPASATISANAAASAHVATPLPAIEAASGANPQAKAESPGASPAALPGSLHGLSANTSSLSGLDTSLAGLIVPEISAPPPLLSPAIDAGDATYGAGDPLNSTGVFSYSLNLPTTAEMLASIPGYGATPAGGAALDLSALGGARVAADPILDIAVPPPVFANAVVPEAPAIGGSGTTATPAGVLPEIGSPALPAIEVPVIEAPPVHEAIAAISAGGARTVIVSSFGTADFATVADALEMAAPGTVIKVRPGTYAEPLVINKPVMVAGDGPVDQIRIVGPEWPLITVAADEVTLSGLTIGTTGDLPKGSSTVTIAAPRCEVIGCELLATQDALSVAGEKATAHLRHCILRGTERADNGLVQDNGTEVVLEDCEITGFNRAIAMAHPESTLRAVRVRCHDHRVECVSISGHVSANFGECEFFRGPVGVEISAGAAATFTACRFHDLALGIECENEAAPVFEDCELRANRESGARITRGATPTFRRCHFIAQGVDGLSISRKAQPIFDECTIEAGERHGLTVTHDAEPHLHACHIIDHKKGVGVNIADSGRAILENCTISGNGRSGIDVHDSGVLTAVGCKVHHNRGGEGVTASGRGDVTLTKCEIFNNGETGVTAQRFGKVTLIECSIHDHAHHGGVLFDSEGFGSLENCEITLNKGFGVSVGPLTVPLLTGGRIHHQRSGDGIYVHPDGRAGVKQVQIDHNPRHGVAVGERGAPQLHSCRIHDNVGWGVFDEGRDAEVIDCELSDNEAGGHHRQSIWAWLAGLLGLR